MSVAINFISMRLQHSVRSDILAKDILSKFTPDAGLFVPTERYIWMKLVDAVDLSNGSTTNISLVNQSIANPCSSGFELVRRLNSTVDILGEDRSGQTVHYIAVVR